MKRFQKLLVIAVIILILINLGLLGFLWRGRQLHQSQNGPILEKKMHQHLSRLGNKLQLAEEQKNAFRLAFESHNQDMKALDRKEQNLRRQIHQAAFQDDEMMLDSLSQVAQQLTAKRIKTYTSLPRNLSKNVDPSQREKLIELLSSPPHDQAKPRRERVRGNR